MFLLKLINTKSKIARIRDRTGTKLSRGRDQVESAGAGINRDFEMLPRPGPGPGLAKICRGRCRGRDFLILILKIFESFWKLVSMWASFKVNLEGSYTMFKYNYTKRCLHYYYELALFHCQISSYSFYRHSLLLARASLGTQGSRVMRAATVFCSWTELFDVCTSYMKENGTRTHDFTRTF